MLAKRAPPRHEDRTIRTANFSPSELGHFVPQNRSGSSYGSTTARHGRMPRHVATADDHEHAEGLALQVVLFSDQFEAFAQRVAHLLEERRDDGFLDANGAAEFLGLTRKAIYTLVERRKLPYHRPAGRLLFDRRALREWVKRA